MAEDTNQWMLFGVDVRTGGHLWLNAWRDFLFSNKGPLRQRLDEPVLLRGSDGDRCFQAGREYEPTDDGLPWATAVQLPDELVLARELRVPVAAEPELHAVLRMEVASGSPFGADDTVFGWEELSRDEDSLTIILAIASRAGISEWYRGRDNRDDGAPEAVPEVWADVGGAKVCIRGFGEDRRESAYRRRLLRMGLICGGALLLILIVASLFAMQQRAMLGNLQSMQARVQQETVEVSAMRETLVSANETIEAANALVARYPNPHLEIARLTELLKDDAYLAHFSMRGTELRIRGRALDAATVMQTLAETPAYAAVTAPQAITAVGNTGLEQFHLDIDLGSQGPVAEVDQ